MVEDDEARRRDVARAIRAIQGDEGRPLSWEEARELERLRKSLPRPSKQFLRDLGKRIARPEHED